MPLRKLQTTGSRQGAKRTPTNTGLIAQYLGHSNVEVTRKVYARYSPDYLRKAASALEL